MRILNEVAITTKANLYTPKRKTYPRKDITERQPSQLI